MTRNELIEKVARSIEDVSIMCDTYCLSDEDSINVAKAAISTILAALQDPTREMYESAHKHYEGEAYLPHGLWRAMLAASPLGEQSE